MAAISDDIRIDIKEALAEVVSLLEAFRMGLETTVAKATEKDISTSLLALGHFVARIDQVLGEIDELVDRLLAEGAGAEQAAANGEMAEAFAFYGDPANYEQVRGRPSKIARDAGAKARKLQELLAGEGAAQ